MPRCSEALFRWRGVVAPVTSLLPDGRLFDMMMINLRMKFAKLSLAVLCSAALITNAGANSLTASLSNNLAAAKQFDAIAQKKMQYDQAAWNKASTNTAIYGRNQTAQLALAARDSTAIANQSAARVATLTQSLASAQALTAAPAPQPMAQVVPPAAAPAVQAIPPAPVAVAAAVPPTPQVTPAVQAVPPAPAAVPPTPTVAPAVKNVPPAPAPAAVPTIKPVTVAAQPAPVTTPAVNTPAQPVPPVKAAPQVAAPAPVTAPVTTAAQTATPASLPASVQTTAAPAAAPAPAYATQNDVNNRFSSLKNTVDSNKKEASAGIAGVGAMSNIPQITDSMAFGVGAGAATHDGESAVAVGFSGRASKNVIMKASVAADTQSGFTIGGGVLVGW